MAGIPQGGIPMQQMAPSPQMEQAPPQAGPVPTAPDGGKLVEDALTTLTKFAVSQREKGNPAIVEALQGLVMAMAGEGEAPPEMGMTPDQQVGPLQAKPVQGGNIPINA